MEGRVSRKVTLIRADEVRRIRRTGQGFPDETAEIASARQSSQSAFISRPGFLKSRVLRDRSLQSGSAQPAGDFGHDRLGGTGYVSILPVDQGVEHSAGASFAGNPECFDPSRIVQLAVEGGCNAVASALGTLGAVARKYSAKIPFIVKLNHNELLSYSNKFDQVMFATVRQAWDMGAAAVGATIYFGSAEATRQLQEVGQAFAEAHA